MKNIISALTAVLVLGTFAIAQERGKQIEGKPLARSPELSRKDRSSGVEAGTSIEAQLQQSLDVKNAKVGDQVVMKVTRSVKQNGRTIVEKGSKLVGRVSEVQKRTKDNAGSRLGVVFDRIQGQNLDAPLNASIVSMTQAAASLGAGDTADAGFMGSSSSSGTVTRGGSGGGLLGGGGVVGGVVNTTASTVGTVTDAAGQAAGSVVNTTRGVASSTKQAAGRTVNGINIAPSVGGWANGSTTLSAADKNLRLEKGVIFKVQVNQ